MSSRDISLSGSSLPGLWRSPTYRKANIRTSHLWLKGKQLDDNTNGFWRVHDGLYDFSTFIDKHPGGSDWLNYTKVGTELHLKILSLWTETESKIISQIK